MMYSAQYARVKLQEKHHLEAMFVKSFELTQILFTHTHTQVNVYKG